MKGQRLIIKPVINESSRSIYHLMPQFFAQLSSKDLWSLKRKWELEPSVMLLVCLEHQVVFLPWMWGSISKCRYLLKGWGSAQCVWPFSFVCSSHTLPHLRHNRNFGVGYIEFKYPERNFFYCAERLLRSQKVHDSDNGGRKWEKW